ncbi:MAG TPA: tetratricopeptide repeat protein [Terriglobia bacterium]|nr:tetratricopeptide repeat protein [Terriglobia bacterium]
MRGNRWIPLSLLLLAGLSCHRAGRQITAQQNPPRQLNSSQSPGGFDYYDKSEFKPGGVSASVDPGGYSAAKEVDSYSLMLEYAAAEGAAPSSGTGAVAAPARGQADTVSASPPTATELNSWTESQFLAHGSDSLLSHAIQASVEIFQVGVARFPDSVKLHTGLGIALTARGDYEKAIASLLRATDLAPSDPRPYFVLAKAYAGSPQPRDKVPKRLERLVTLDPRNPQALYYYALALEKGGGKDPSALAQAESLLERSLALDPNFADAHLQLGVLHAARSHDADAIREYQAAVKLKPSLAAAHYRLAQAYARAGQKEAAQSELDLYERLRKPALSSPH